MTPPEQRQELLPCPFCGMNPESGPKKGMMGCINPKCIAACYANNWADWNRRTTPGLVRNVERLTKVIEAAQDAELSRLRAERAESDAALQRLKTELGVDTGEECHSQAEFIDHIGSALRAEKESCSCCREKGCCDGCRCDITTALNAGKREDAGKGKG